MSCIRPTLYVKLHTILEMGSHDESAHILRFLEVPQKGVLKKLFMAFLVPNFTHEGWVASTPSFLMTITITKPCHNCTL